MRRFRTRHYSALAAASVGVAALALSLLAPTAQAAGGPDLSITKTVASAGTGTTIDASQFIPSIADMRNGASVTFVDEGMRIRTTGTADKAAQYWPQSGPIPSAATISWVQEEGIQMPGMQIVFDADGILGNGNADWNVLVNQPSGNGNNWWLPNTAANSAIAKAAAPSCNNPGPACVGTVNGSPYYGTLAGWIAALPAAKVYAVGFSLGSGASGINSGVISAMTYGTQQYTFGGFSSSAQAAPGEVVEYKLSVTNAVGADPATGVVVADTLPAELSYVNGSLIDNGNGCAFVGKVLTCNAGSFPPGTSTTIKFKAKVSPTVPTGNLQSTQGHWVDVQKQEVFADLPAGQTQTYAAMCPAGYIPTDGGLLVDAVDQGGFYSDLVTVWSKPITQSGIKGWSVKVKNFGDHRGQGKVKVTCLAGTVGSSNGHTHNVVTTQTPFPAISMPAVSGPATVTRTCAPGTQAVAAEHDVLTGVAVVRSSSSNGSSWTWVIDHSPSAQVAFNVTCLNLETSSANGHTASLVRTTAQSTVSVGPEARAEKVQLCPGTAHAITGGWTSPSASLLSLGREQRGTNYMFRFYNDDWDSSYQATVQVVCLDVRTPDEQSYYDITNTATVSAAGDQNTGNNTSSAVLHVSGAPVAGADDPASQTTGTRTVNGNGKTTAVKLDVTCPVACSFTIKVIKNGDVVAKLTSSLPASPNPQPVSVPTTSLGKNLGPGPVTVKIKTDDGTTTQTVTLT